MDRTQNGSVSPTPSHNELSDASLEGQSVNIAVEEEESMQVNTAQQEVSADTPKDSHREYDVTVCCSI